ncbi:MAG: LUD domain-containing protein [Opitutaceae bacterium]|jgi:L-lactate dehydrogenase complex protein LldG
MNTDREAILSRVRSALAPLPQRAQRPDWEAELVHMRTMRGDVDAWTLFRERLKLVNGLPLEGAAALVDWLDQNGWRHGYCDPELWPRLQAAFPATFTVEAVFDRTRVDDYQFGITRAAGAVAETGSLILTDASTSRRLAALTPWVHIAVVSRGQIHLDLQHAMTALADDPNIVFCTGPSKTADVEGILIEGVHGPGQQVALLLE